MVNEKDSIMIIREKIDRIDINKKEVENWAFELCKTEDGIQLCGISKPGECRHCEYQPKCKRGET